MKFVTFSSPEGLRPNATLIGSLAALAFAANLPAATVAAYRFNTNDTAGLNVSEFDAGFLTSASAVTPNSGYSLFAAQNSSNDTGLSAYGTNQPVLRLSRVGESTSLTTALGNGSYFSITLTPATTLSLTSLTFNAARGGDSANRGLAIFSNAAGFDVSNASSFTESDAAFYVQHFPVQRDFVPAGASFSVDLSAEAYQNLTASVTFYFYTFTPGSGSSMEIDNIVFMAIPEPSGMLLGGIGMVSLLLRRTRRSAEI